ncbi:MAG: sensor histidine kinase [Salibacteraceae bacterium]
MVGIIALGITVRLLIDLVFALSYRNYPLFEAPLDYFISVIMAFFIVDGTRRINRRLNTYMPWTTRPLSRFITQAAANIAFAAGLIVLTRTAFIFLLAGSGFIGLFNEMITIAVVASVTLIFVSVDLSFFLLTNWRNSLVEIERFKKENIETQFEMLKNQVNPHFLFNSLNTLSSLVYSNPEYAANFIRQLSQVYRYVLENKNKEVIALKDEIEVLQAYIELLELRFSNNLEFKLHIEEELMTSQIAPLTLQMLIENAIKHNIISRKRPLTITINSTADHRIQVSNNLQKKTSVGYSSEIGLQNIRSRYAYISNREVEVIETETEFTVIIPVKPLV